ncbi:MAG TPA: cell division protein FtsH, partial [Nitrospirales bacterium]|nr:cell division protein FtsH [Nitrospirales bacterium]
MNSRSKNLIFWVVIGLFMILLFNLLNAPQRAPIQEVPFSDFITKLEEGEVREVTIIDRTISGVFKEGNQFTTYAVDYPDLVPLLRKHDVRVEAKPDDNHPWYITFLVTWGPFILFLGLWFFLMRQMQIGGNRALSFGKSRARQLTEDRKKITFDDVAG